MGTNKKQLHYKWNWQLRSRPHELWELVSNTNRLFKNLNLPTVQPTDISYEINDGHLQLSYNSIKYNDAWIEEPYEWEYPYRYSVKRHYKNGGYEEVRIHVEMFPNSQGTRLQYQMWLTPKNKLAYYYTKIRHKLFLRAKLKSAFKKYAILVEKNQLPYQFENTSKVDRGSIVKLNETKQELQESTQNPVIAQKICDYISKADDIDLIRIEPHKLAQHWGEELKDVINGVLYGVKKGLLNFNWDLYCPRCRTIQQRCKTLNEVHEPIFCHDCNHEFSVNFNQSLQLSFRPNPLIRKIKDEFYSLAGPQEKPHVKIQQFIKPEKARYVNTYLEEGTYQLRCSEAEGIAVFKVTEEGQDTVNVRLTNFGLNGVAEISNRPNLIFENQTRTDQIFVLEKVEWNDKKLTASQVTSLQLFRDLFANEVLPKGEKIAVDKLTLMFTDIYDSTGMYHKEGEEHAISRVMEHFEILQDAVAKEDGALVKTIGDAIMAVFSNPDKAFKAFITAQEIISKDRRFDKSLKLKAGIHHGNCVAVNLNNKIDYFGSTVNIASRLVDAANENEIIISEDVASNEHIQQLLDEKYSHFNIQQEYVPLKGFDEQEFKLQRIHLEQSALRLVV
ncbi:MAG: adenylate/guanylate cyclase domain-containing protein [Balneolaceae bacterium]|nr:adenylate/guanylate cyclase domain-containing protein [Balneolaceae bacterium]